MNKMPMQENTPKEESKFKKILRVIFVNNFTYKLMAVIGGAIVWLLITGL